MEDAFNRKSPRISILPAAPLLYNLLRQVVILREENDEKEIEKINKNEPLLPFTLGDECKVIDFIVRIEDYLAKRFLFIDKNFGDGVFPKYSRVTLEKTVYNNMSGLLAYNHITEKRLLKLKLIIINCTMR